MLTTRYILHNVPIMKHLKSIETVSYLDYSL